MPAQKLGLNLTMHGLGTKSKWLIRAVMASALCLIATGVPASPRLRVIYPRPETPFDSRSGYPLAVLRLALEHLHVNFVLTPSAIVLTQARTLKLLESDQVVTVGWSVATAERDWELRTISIPIDRGLIGWRVLLIRRGDEKRFSSIRTASQLVHIPMAQGHDWPDLTILRDNGFDVAAAADYTSLFMMLKKGRIDAIPRSVAEVGQELHSSNGTGLTVETHLLLHYPSSLVFFVAKDNAPLAADLQKGLQEAVADGSLQRLFKRTYSHNLSALHLRNRRVIELVNPLLPKHLLPTRHGLQLQRDELQ
jgi:ABC-type amino acid transport substrate-binding protein